ncbi:hypothetical protein D3C81_1942830 [compost metagenome]
MPPQGRNTQQQLALGFFLDRVRYRHAKKRLGETRAGRQFDVQLDFLGQCQHLGPLERRLG